MIFDTKFDVVVEMDFPLGESSDLAYDTWGRDIRAKLQDINARVVRTRNHLKISAPRVTAQNPRDVAWLIELILNRICSQASEDITIRIHQLPAEKRVAAEEQLQIEEVL